jgi:type II secretory pathway component PulF
MVRYFRKSWFTARPKRCRLSAEEADQLFGKLAELHTAGLSLSAGLRAAVTDSADGRLAQTCLQLADRLDQGMSLDQALGIGVSSSSPPVLPHQVYTHSLIAVSLRHHDLGAALETLLDHQRQVREIGSRVIGSLAYPLSVLLFAMLILVMLAFWVVPVFGEMFSDFGLNLPPLTRAVIRISALLTQAMTGWQTLAGWSLLAVAGLLLGIAVGGLRLGWFGARHRQELVGSIPMLGSVFDWMSAVGFARLLALLLERQVPLPTALRLTSEGLVTPSVQEACLRLANGVEQGGDFADLIERESVVFPSTLVPFVRTGQRQGMLPDSLRTAAELLLSRVELRATVFQLVTPTLVFVFVGCLVVLVTLGLFLPFTNMLSALR